MSDLRDGSDRNVLYWKALRDTLGRMRQAEGEAPASPGAGTLPPDDGGREEGLKELRSLRVRLEEALEEQTSLMERLDSMPSDGVLLDGLVQATHYMLERQTEANEGLGKYLGELESLRGSAAPQAPAGAADGSGTCQNGEARASGAAEDSTAAGSAAEAEPESGPQGQSGSSWRAAAGDIVAGRYDTDRDKLLDVLEAAIAGADRENVPDAERGPLKAAQEHFTDLLARVSSDTGTEKTRPLREAAESEAPAASEASDARETGENAPAQDAPGEESAEGAPKRIPVTRGDGGEQAVPLRRVSAHDEPGTASLPDWMADIVGIAAGRFDTGSSLADVQTQSELLRRAIDRARQEGREQDFRPWFDQASAHINALLRGAAAVEGTLANEVLVIKMRIAESVPLATEILFYSERIQGEFISEGEDEAGNAVKSVLTLNADGTYAISVNDGAYTEEGTFVVAASPMGVGITLTSTDGVESAGMVSDTININHNVDNAFNTLGFKYEK